MILVLKDIQELEKLNFLFEVNKFKEIEENYNTNCSGP